MEKNTQNDDEKDLKAAMSSLSQVTRRQLVGKPAPDFILKDQLGQPFHLYDALAKGPALLVFYPGDFTAVCTKQLCNYRDAFSHFQKLGIQVVGISHNATKQHADFAKTYNFPFPLLSDTAHLVAKQYGCRSLFMLGGVSRAVAIVNQKKVLLYRYIEPTVLTRRTADELVAILRDLRASSLI